MQIGTITYGDVGNWYLGNEGLPLLLLKCYGMLLYCDSPAGRIYYPAHDVIKQLSEHEATLLTAKPDSTTTQAKSGKL